MEEARTKAEEIYNLGRTRLSDPSSVSNCAEAARYFREAAEQGLPAAQFDLAKLYFEGNGVPKSYITGARWLRRAANHWDSDYDAVQLLDLIEELQAARRRERKLRRAKAKSLENHSAESPRYSPQSTVCKPWEVLDLELGTSRAEIAEAYAIKVQLFEPDNVQNLPAELRDFANRISSEIRKAYDELMGAKTL